jgi:hypothetical protein
VEYEGMAKTHMFFKPVEIEDGVFAGSVRGRGLLAMRGSDDTDDKAVVSIHPILLSVEDNQIRPKAAITNFVEWHHEHSIKSLKYKEKESSRVPAAEEWIEVSKAVRFATVLYPFLGQCLL